MVIRTLTMREAAQAVDLSWERFRKVWPDMVRNLGFPAPFRGRRWDADQVEAWRLRRSARLLAPGDVSPQAAPGASAARRADAQLELLRAG